VTLIEMLVTVAVLVIIMTILAQVFQAATGAVSAVQTIQGLDDKLRLLDATIRSDLAGATTTFTPPVDPAQNKGYFEYGENEFADSQGEDSDDYIRFTAKAPVGKPFLGRIYVKPPIPIATMTAAQLQIYLSSQPVTIASDYAEIIYFVRNGNLYRRVLLVAPERQSLIYQMFNNTDGNGNHLTPGYLQPSVQNPTVNVSWQGVNDLSAHPTATFNSSYNIILNTLGDLTNRENRAFYPRFANDFFSVQTGPGGQDGFPDDLNNDNVPDYYPSLYYGLFNGAATQKLIYEPVVAARPDASDATMAFPYVYPGAYTTPQQLSDYRYGWIHSPSPYANVYGNLVSFDPGLPGTFPAQPPHPQSWWYLQNINHNPLDLGDNLPTPGNLDHLKQTWWGFPTWRETLAPVAQPAQSPWNDPTFPLFPNPITGVVDQPNGLLPRTQLPLGNGGVGGGPNGNWMVRNDANLLPPMAKPASFPPGFDFSSIRRSPQLFSDTFGEASTFWGGAGVTAYPQWFETWEDDLIMTGVRSFDVKAYDNAFAGYVDLGWGDDPRYSGLTGVPFLAGNPDLSGNNVYPPLAPINGSSWDYINRTFAHEGRMPPMVEDNRIDPQNPNPTYIKPNMFIAQYPAINPNYSSNIGDDDGRIIRLRRVWDSWSTAYSRAPATGVTPGANPPPPFPFPAGPPFSPPIYPSYPPPYPAPLRGIQIQIRVVDPANQRVKSLTIRQDFTDKL
jgi:hypothetical protein